MSSGQSVGVKKEWVYGWKLYLHDLCFTASLKGPFPTEYWFSDVPSISLWALETGMNVMSSFGRLCCLLLLWFKATPQWKWVQDRLWELSCDWQPADWDTRWIDVGPSGSLWVGGLLVMDCGCDDGQKSNNICLKVCIIMMTGWAYIGCSFVSGIHAVLWRKRSWYHASILFCRKWVGLLEAFQIFQYHMQIFLCILLYV